MSEQEIFLAAVEISDPPARQAYLDQACAENLVLREQIEALLKVHATAGDFLATPAVEQMAPASPVPEGNLPSASGSAESEKTHGYSHDPQGGDDDVSLGFLSPSDKPGSLGRLAHYEVHEVLGHGAFGIVLKAFDEKLHRMVAIKVMSPELAATSPPRKRFLREARASAAIRHEHVVAVYAVEEQPIPYLVMEYIPGLTLDQALKEHGPLDVADVLRIGQQIACGLAAAHAQGLTHRDIKPANILLENGLAGRVKITDFGLARAADDASMTQSGMIAGTPLYMSPEQATSGQIDQRSDLFSLGSVLYVMISGRPPFRASTTLAVLKRVVDDTPRPIPEIIADVPSWLCAIISKLHAKQPEDRFATASEVADLLGRCLADLQANRPVQLPADIQIAEEKPVETAEPKPAVGDGGIPAMPSPGFVHAPSHSRTTSRPWPTLAAIALIALAGLGFTEATGVTKLTSTVIRLTTGSGTLVIETDDPGVKVTIDGEDVQIQGAGVEQLTLKPGQYQVAAVKDGKPVSQQLVTITRGGREVVRVTMIGNGTVAAASTTKNGTGWHGWPADAPPPAIAPFDAEQAKQHQEAWAKYLQIEVEYTNSLGMKFTLIPPGEFTMGSTPAEIEATLKYVGDDEHWHECIKSEAPQHTVILTQPIYLSVNEVTQAEYEKVMGVNPSHFAPMGDGKDAVAGMETTDHPVETVSWKDAAEFCAKLSQQEKFEPFYFRAGETITPLDGTGYRLPTEAEWEYACRAGTTTKFWIGDKDEELVGAGWFGGNSGWRTHAAGELKANPFGLFDIHGNVWEWVEDWWEPMYYRESQGKPAINPSGPSTTGSRRVFRGGYWSHHASYCRSSSRDATDPASRGSHVGFRVSLPVDAVKQALPQTPLAADPDRAAAEYVLSIGGQIKIREHGEEREIKAATDLPAGEFELTVVGLDNNLKATDAGVAVFQDCRNLRVLNLGRVPVTDAGFAYFQNCTNLESLGLNLMSVSNAGLAHFRSCNRLQHLRLISTNCSDAGLAHFRDCSELRELDLENSRGFTDAGLAHFQGCKELRILDLTNTNVSDVGLVNFEDCQNLTHLDLGGTQVTDAGLAYFQGCKNLEMLYLSNTQVSDAGLAHFLECQKLTHLLLDATQVTDAGLVHLKNWPKLGMLALSNTAVSDAGLVDLLKFPGRSISLANTRVSKSGYEQLKIARPDFILGWSEPNRMIVESVLALGGTAEIGTPGEPESRPVANVADLPAEYFQVRRVSLAGVDKPLEKLPEMLSQLKYPKFDQLESLDLSGIAGLTYEFLKPIHGLRELNLARAGLTDVALAQLPKLPTLQRLVLDGNDLRGPGLASLKEQPELTELSLGCPALGDLFAKHLAELKQVKRLSLAGSGLSDAGIKHLAGLTNLESLDLRKTKVTAAGIDELKQSLPKCRIAWDGGVVEPTAAP